MLSIDLYMVAHPYRPTENLSLKSTWCLNFWDILLKLYHAKYTKYKYMNKVEKDKATYI